MQRLVWTPELVATFWDGVAQTRLMDQSFFKTGGRGIFNLIGRYFKPGTTCLDIGAGDGDLAEWAMKKGCKVAVYEPSSARQATLLSKPFTKSANFLGLVSPDTNQRFDIVVATEVIEHILDEEMESFLSILRNSLKHGGALIISTPNDEDLETGMALCPTTGTLFHRWQHVRSFTKNSLTDLLSGAGFEAVAVHAADYSALQRGRVVGSLLAIFRRLMGKHPQGLVYVGTLS